METKDLIAEINRRIEEKSILKHPFYQDWKSGKLTKGMLREYSKQYYKHVAAFPQYLSTLHSRMDDFGDRSLVLKNLMDEEVGEKNHIRLWVNFGNALGVSADEMRASAPIATTRAFIDHFRNMTGSRSIAEGIASLYAYESQIPKVSEEKIHGLVNLYGIYSEEGLEYFKVHMLADVEHSGAELELIKKYCQDEVSQERALEAIDSTLDAYWEMLTGIFEEKIDSKDMD